MPILTLTTDWGLNDHYVAAFKGSVLSGCPNISIVDISNTIESHDIIRASYVLKSCYRNFPDGTIHFIGVSRYDNVRKKDISAINRIALKCDKQFFIGSDSGIFSLVLGNAPKEIVMLRGAGFRNEFQKYADAVCHLAQEKSLSELGERAETINELYLLAPTTDSTMIRCSVIYFDSFGNVVTNLTRQQFEEGSRGRKFTIWFPDNTSYLNSINSHYTDVDNGEMVALFNNAGYLEIAQNCGNAEKMFGLKLMDTLRVEFENYEK
jgi:S-adenosyl-L-methionine hydrolase (adenosine-forming)